MGPGLEAGSPQVPCLSLSSSGSSQSCLLATLGGTRPQPISGDSPYLLCLGTQGVVGDAPHLPVLHTREPGPFWGPGQRGAVGNGGVCFLLDEPKTSPTAPILPLFCCCLTFFLPSRQPWEMGSVCIPFTEEGPGWRLRGHTGSAGSIHTQAPPQLGVTWVAVLSPRTPGPRLGPHPPAGPTSPLLNIGCPTPPSCNELCLEGVEAVPSRDSQPRFPSSLTPLLTVTIV